MRSFRILPSVISFGLTRTLLVAALVLIGPAVLSADVIYTYVESLPAQFIGDQPTATWSWTEPSFQTADTGSEFDSIPVLSPAAITDGYTWDTLLSGVFFATSDTDQTLSYVSVEDVTFTIGTVGYTPLNWYEDCQPVLSETACTLPSSSVTWTVSNADDVSSVQADSFNVQVTGSVPEPGTWATGLLGLGALCMRRTLRR